MPDVELIFDVKAETAVAINSVFDVQSAVPFHNTMFESLSITLNSNALSDSFNLNTVIPAANPALDDTFTGRILDYDYRFKANEKSVSGKRVSISGRYSDDKLVYTRYSFTIPNSETIGVHDGKFIFRASSYFNGIARALGLNPRFYCADWAVKAGSLPTGNVTYQNLLSSFFGWRSDLPQVLINVFIRGNDLFAVERGWEQDVIDDNLGQLVELLDSRNVVQIPSVSIKRMRTESAVTIEYPDGSGADSKDIVDEPEPFTGTISFGTARLTYEDGYLKERVEGTRVTKYTYVTYDNKLYLSVEEMLDSDAETANKTEYEYVNNNDVLYLAVEKRYSGGTIVNNVPDYTDAVIITTTHSPLGNGWYGTTTRNESTDEVTTALVQGGPANSISQYTLKKTQEATNSCWDITKKLTDRILARLLGTPIINTNFPIDTKFGVGGIFELAKEVDWLNNAIEERISMEVVNISHVINFTDIIHYKWNYYNLESNSISVTPGGIRQSIEIVRWYKGDESKPIFEEG